MRLNLGRVLSHTAGSLADEMRENREYVRDAKDRMQADLYQKGLERRQAVKAARLDMESAVDFLTDEGLDQEKIVALLSENPKEFLQFYKTAQQAKLEGRLSSDILNNAVKVAQGYQASDMTPSELIKAATPDFIQGTDLEVEEDKRSGLAKLFRRPDLGVIMSEVYANDAMAGVKGGDIIASMQADLVQGKKGPKGASVEYRGLTPMDPTDIYQFQGIVTKRYDDALEKEIIRLNAIDRSGMSADENTALQKRIDDAKKLQDIEDDGLRMEAIMTQTDVGFDIAKEFNRMSPQIFADQPAFISPDLYMNYIAGDEQYERPEQPDSIPGDEPEDTIEVNTITITADDDADAKAQAWFNSNPDETELVIEYEDGTRIAFEKVGSGRRTRIRRVE